MMLIRTLILIAIVAASFGRVHADVPPDSVHFQGVLRNSAGAPLGGTHDMLFRFFNAFSGGIEILVDQHPAVAVTGGLFDVALGDGNVSDGAGPGSYTSLSAMFRDYASVFVQIEVNTEVLSPRVRARATPYAHNTTNLAGRPGESLRWNSTSDAFEFTDDVEIVGEVVLGNGANQIRGKSVNDSLRIFAGTSESHGGLKVNGSSDFNLYSGDGTFWFRNGASANVVTASLAPNGDFQVARNLKADGGTITLGSGLNQIRGVSSSGNLWVMGGLVLEQGGLEVRGGSDVSLYSGDGTFWFKKGLPTATVTASLAPNGDLQIDGNLTAEGGFLIGPPQNHLRIQSDSNLRFMSDADNSTTTNPFEWFHDGSYTNPSKVGELQESGNLRIRGTLSQNVAFDLAESFLAGESLFPGELVRVHPSRPDAVMRTTGSSDRGVLGVVSERPGVLLGSAPFDPESLRRVWGEAVFEEFVASREALDAKVLARHPEFARRSFDPDHAERLTGLALEAFCEERLVPVALAGRVPVRAIGPIEVGDPLGPSAVPGMAARAAGSGPVVGLALEPLAAGEGKVLAFVARGVPVVERPPAPSFERAGVSVPEHSDAAAYRVSLEGDPGITEPRGTTRQEPIDFTESFAMIETVGPGDVVVASTEKEGSLALAREPHDRAVVGVVAPASAMGGLDPARAAVVVAGTVLVKADAGYGLIRVGDLLAASPTPGHAMRATEPLPGTILGKALTSLEHGTGTLRMILMLR